MASSKRIVFVIIFCGIFTQAHSQQKKIGNQAPEMTFNGIDGRTYSYSEFTDKTLLVSFLNTTRDGRIQELISEYSQFQKDGFFVILVLKSKQEPLINYKAKFDIPYVMIADLKLKTAKAFGLSRRLRKKSFTADFLLKNGEIVELSYGEHLPLYRINQF